MIELLLFYSVDRRRCYFVLASCHKVGGIHMMAYVVSRIPNATRQSVSFWWSPSFYDYIQHWGNIIIQGSFFGATCARARLYALGTFYWLRFTYNCTILRYIPELIASAHRSWLTISWLTQDTNHKQLRITMLSVRMCTYFCPNPWWVTFGSVKDHFNDQPITSRKLP